MTHPSPSTNAKRRRWWIAPSVLVLGLYAGFFAFAVAQACTITTVVGHVDCVAKNTDGTYTAYFGYYNTYDGVSSEGVGFWNEIVTVPSYQPIQSIDSPPKPQVSVVPPSFKGKSSGIVNYAFAVNFSATENPNGIAWQEGRNSQGKPLEQIAPVSNTCTPGIHATTTTPSIMVGQTATIAANVQLHLPTNTQNVQSPPPALTGAVNFSEHGVTLPVVPASENPVYVTNKGAMQFSTTIDTKSLTFGQHTITATYSDGYYAPVSNTVAINVLQAPSTCSILVSPQNPTTATQPVTYTVVVGAGAAGIPTGTVSFSGFSKTHSPQTLVNGQTSVIAAISDLNPSLNMITATYVPDTTAYSTTTCTTTYPDIAIPTSTTITSSQNPSVQGQGVTFTATITSTVPNVAPPTGPVTFDVDGVQFASYTLTSGNQVTSSVVTTMSVGTHNVRAIYWGAPDFIASTGSLTQIVGAVPPPSAGNNSAYIRIAQTANAPTDIAIDGVTAFHNLNQCTVGTYYPVSAGSHSFKVNETGKPSYTQTITLGAGDYYTLAFVDDPSAKPAVAQNLVVFQDDLSVAPGNAKVRIYHLFPELGPVSVTANNAVVVASLSFENASSYLTQAPGTELYTFIPFQTPSGALNRPITEAPNQVYSIFLMCSYASFVDTGGIPTALPQTGFAPIQSTDWNAIAFLMGALAIGGAGIGGVSGLAVVQYRRRRRS